MGRDLDKQAYFDIVEKYDRTNDHEAAAKAISKMQTEQRLFVLKALGEEGHELMSEEMLPLFETALALNGSSSFSLQRPALGLDILTANTKPHIVEFIIKRHIVFNLECSLTFWNSSKFIESEQPLLSKTIWHKFHHPNGSKLFSPDFSTLEKHHWGFLLEEAKSQKSVLSWLITSQYTPDYVAETIVSDFRYQDSLTKVDNTLGVWKLIDIKINPTFRLHNLGDRVARMKQTNFVTELEDIDIINMQLCQAGVAYYEDSHSMREKLASFHKELLLEEGLYDEEISVFFLEQMAKEVINYLPKSF